MKDSHHRFWIDSSWIDSVVVAAKAVEVSPNLDQRAGNSHRRRSETITDPNPGCLRAVILLAEVRVREVIGVKLRSPVLVEVIAKAGSEMNKHTAPHGFVTVRIVQFFRGCHRGANACGEIKLSVEAEIPVQTAIHKMDGIVR